MNNLNEATRRLMREEGVDFYQARKILARRSAEVRRAAKVQRERHAERKRQAYADLEKRGLA